MPSTSRVIMCAAGGGKTTRIVSEALKETKSQIAIVTYTRNNHKGIEEMFYDHGATIPARIEALTWFTFLLRELARPYRRVMHTQRIDGLFWEEGRSVPYVPESNTGAHYFIDGRYIYSDKISKFICECDRRSGGRRVAAPGAAIRPYLHRRNSGYGGL